MTDPDAPPLSSAPRSSAPRSSAPRSSAPRSSEPSSTLLPRSAGPRPTDLLGIWQLQRHLLDRRAGLHGRVRGWLELTLVGSVVHWLEYGELVWAGARHEVTRELHVVPDPGAGSGWQVRFADGGAFHDWAPGQVVEHPCRADRYRGLVVVDQARSSLRVLWDVIGPEKDQRIVTRCRRRPDLRASPARWTADGVRLDPWPGGRQLGPPDRTGQPVRR